jgi:hypothetical protein
MPQRWGSVARLAGSCRVLQAVHGEGRFNEIAVSHNISEPVETAENTGRVRVGFSGYALSEVRFYREMPQTGAVFWRRVCKE